MALGTSTLGVDPLGGRSAASSLTVTLGRAATTDSARAATSHVNQIVVLGRASTTTTARAAKSAQRKALGRAAAGQTARPLTIRQVIHLGRSTEADSARPVRHDATVVLGRASEGDAARSVSPHVRMVLGRAAEADAGRGLGNAQVKHLARAAEADAARTVNALVDVTIVVGRATETDAGRSLAVINDGAITVTLGRPVQSTAARSIHEAPLVHTGTTSVVNFGVNPGNPSQLTDLVVIAMDKVLHRAPTSLAVSVSGAEPGELLSFKIDGTEVDTANANGDGTLQQISIAVPGALGAAGVHTVTVDSATHTGSDTFTIDVDPIANPLDVSTDTDPVLIPEAQVTTDFYKWVLQDLMPDGLGSWVMPINPSTMSSPGVITPVQVQHSTAVFDGQFHIWQGGLAAVDWTFAGYCPDQAFYEQLVAYASLTYRFYVIDHRNRAWKVAITGLDMVARKRAIDETGAPQDWRHDYTARAVIYEQTPRVPA